LEAQGRPLRRASRSAEVTFDWDDPGTWDDALRGAGAAYVVYTPDLAVPAAPAAIRAFAERALAHGLERLVLLSGRGEPEAQRCERILADTVAGRADWTVVRAAWFQQNFSEGAFLEPVLAGSVALPAGEVPEPFVDVDDVADVAVAALTEDGHAGEVYEVTGPRLLTFAEAVADVAAAAGREVSYAQLTMPDFRAYLAGAGVPDGYGELLEYLFTEQGRGHNAHVTDGVQRALGRAPRDLRDYARDAAAADAWRTAGAEV
ncbi:MAG: NmrA family transcriptional regulator, partial [Planctomycetota bacterium]